MTRYRNKIVQRIPGGEVQFGLKSRRLIVWLRGRCYVWPSHRDIEYESQKRERRLAVETAREERRGDFL